MSETDPARWPATTDTAADPRDPLTRALASPDPTRPRLAAPGGRFAPAPAPAAIFTQPAGQVVLMLVVLALVGAGGWFAYGRILPIFRANVWLNGLIFAVFVMGVLACFWQVAQLVASVSWIERFAARRARTAEAGVPAIGIGEERAPRLLAPLAALLGGRGAGGAEAAVIGTDAAQSILSSVATRIDEARDITRYLSNLLIFLGLLGTFYGLAITVPAVVETIRALAPQPGEDGIAVFEKLMGGLEAQLGGMATAFSSSLLGLAGSLVVGLLDLFATHGQNRFYRELEEWMSGFTRVASAPAPAVVTADAAPAASLTALIDDLGTHLARIDDWHAARDDARTLAAAQADERVMLLADSVAALVERQDAARAEAARHGAGLAQMAAASDRLVALAEAAADRDAARDALPAPAAAVPDLSGIEAALHRLVVDLNDGREEMLSELRSDLLILTRAVRAARFGDPFRDDLLPPGPGGHERRG